MIFLWPSAYGLLGAAYFLSFEASIGATQDKVMEITEKLIAAGTSERGGLSKRQLALLGVDWPPTRGLKKSVIGRPISQEDAQEFIHLARRDVERKA